MARRKTRTKLRFQIPKAIADLDNALAHLQYLDELQEGRHPIVEEHMPLIVVGFNTLKTALKRFREAL